MKRPAFTLIELIVAVIVVAALASLVAPLLANFRVTTPDGQFKSAQQIATESTMTVTRDAIVSDVLDQQQLPAANATAYPQLQYLFINPANGGTTATFDPRIKKGWRGPYLLRYDSYTVDTANGFTTTYGSNGQRTVLDAWYRPLVLQEDPMTHMWQLVSAGPDRNLLTTTDNIKVIVR